jgi:acyl-CoA reductase-like NAD-dependent aldehyde dehydrogenase
MSMTHEAWQAAAARIKPDPRLLIDGRLVASQASEYHASVNPATEDILTQVPCGVPEDVDRAVESARAAFRDGRWSRKAPQERREILLRLVQLFLEHRAELALLDSLDVGKPISQALSEVDMACDYIRFAAEACDKIADDVLPSHPEILALNVREPVGVVGAILPWNFPMVVVALKLGPALATGNSIILKPSELSPLSAVRIGLLALEAGVPEGVVNIVQGLGSTVGRRLAEHPDIDMLTFTGSTRTGQALLEACGRSTIKKMILECGGKSPHIVFADSPDLDAVADDIVEQTTWNQGQVCIASTRLIVEERVHEALLGKIIERMEALQPGDPLDPATTYGPLASQQHLGKVIACIDGAISSGAVLRSGGKRFERQGFYVQPTVFDGAAADMALTQEEIFGPVLSVTAFRTSEEALGLAHCVPYGLAARIWTSDLARGYALARTLRAGEVTVNAGPPRVAGVGAGASSEPFGQSGFGVEGGLDGLRQYTRRKAIHINLPASMQ